MSDDEFLIAPDPKDPRLTERVEGADQDGIPITTSVVVARPLTLYLNSQEIVTMMSICDYPEYMAIGYLVNQNMLLPDDWVGYPLRKDYVEAPEYHGISTVRESILDVSGRH